MGSTLIELADKDANTIEKIRDSINENHPYLIDLLSSFIDQFELGKYVFTHQVIPLVKIKDGIFITSVKHHYL